MSESTTTEPTSLAKEARPAEPIGQSSMESYHWTILGICVAVLTLSFLLSTVGSEGVEIAGLKWRLPGMCFMHDVVGFDCPGCGLTRSFISLAHGEWLRAWQFNPAGPLLFLLFAAQIPFRLIQLWRLRMGAEPLDSPWLYLPLWGILAVMIVQWIARLGGWLTLP